MFAASCIFAAAVVALVTGNTNLITNGDFEASDVSPTGWSTIKCTAEVIQSDVASGNNSILLTNRQESWSRLRQEITDVVDINKLYHASVKVKHAGSYPAAFQFALRVSYKFTGQNGEDVWKLEYLRTTYDPDRDGWVKIGGELTLAQSLGNPITYADIGVMAVQVANPIDFMIDDFELYELSEDPDWREKALERVEEQRKANLTLRIKAGGTQRSFYTGMKFTVKQVSSEFGIGSTVDSFHLTTNSKYKETFDNSFEWAKPKKSLEWRSTEFNPNLLTWEAADAGIKLLEDMLKRVRGGAIHEADVSKQPNFVQNMQRPDGVYRASMKRTDDVLDRFRYRCEEWDVLHDVLAGDGFLEQKYGSSQIYSDLFSRARVIDYAAKLYLSQSDLLPQDKHIYKLQQFVERLRNNKVIISGIGAHGGFVDKPSPSLILHRLDRISEAQLPIRLTDYSYSDPDATERADVFDQILLAALSHRNVEGFMLEDFWDKDNSRVNASFFEGRDLTPNAAGHALEAWVTKLSKFFTEKYYDVTAREDTTWEPYRLYKGVYEVTAHRYDTNKNEWRLHRTYKVPLIKEKLPADGNYRVTIYL